MRLFIIVLMFSTIINADETNSLLDSIFNDSTEYVVNVNQIDSSFLKMAGDREKSNFFKMANPNEEFNSTDIMKGGLPRQRLICYGKRKNYQFIAYEQGGRGKHNVFLAYKDSSVVAWESFYEIPTKPNELKRMLSKRTKRKTKNAAAEE